MLVSNSACDLDLEMIAAITPIVARGRAKAAVKRRGEPRDLSVRSVEILGETLHIAAIGGKGPSRQYGLMRSLAATRRILA